MEHPSALRSFDQMMKAAKGKKIALFLDYDGTLAPIVDNPDLAFMSDEVNINLLMHIPEMQPLTQEIQNYCLSFVPDACSST